MASKKAGNGKALVKWDAQLAALAEQAVNTEANVGAGSFISCRGGILSYKGAEIPGNKMNVIVIDHILENAFYEGNYDPNNPTAPVCFAFGRTEEEMRPHEKSTSPQADECKGCPQNEWGSADRGKGKACKNIRRLALIAESDLEDIENAETAFLKIPVTSVKAWAGYVRQVAENFKRPPLAVLTEVSVVPDAKSQFKVLFKLVSEFEEADVIEALIAKNAKVSKEIDFPYVQIENAQPQQRVKGRKVVPAPARGKGKAAAATAAPARKSKF